MHGVCRFGSRFSSLSRLLTVQRMASARAGGEGLESVDDNIKPEFSVGFLRDDGIPVQPKGAVQVRDSLFKSNKYLYFIKYLIF